MDFFPLKIYKYHPRSQNLCRNRQPDGMDELFSSIMMDILSQRPTKKEQPRTWRHVLGLTNYRKEDIEIETKDNIVYVCAKRTVGDEENCDMYETKRRVALPEDVNAEKIKLEFRNGRLQLEAPYKMKETDVKNEDADEKCDCTCSCVEQDHESDGEKLDSDGKENNETEGEESDRSAGREGTEADMELDKTTVTSASTSQLTEVADDGMYNVQMSLSSFNPDDIKVTCQKNSVKVQANTEHKHEDGGRMSRSFCREMTLPDDVVVDQLKCVMSEDGSLRITAPRNRENTVKDVPVVRME